MQLARNAGAFVGRGRAQSFHIEMNIVDGYRQLVGEGAVSYTHLDVYKRQDSSLR